MKLVLDASVAVKLVVPELGQKDAWEVLRQPAERIAPEFLLVEVANTFWKKVGRGELTPMQAASGMDLVRDALMRTVPDMSLAAEALAIAVEINHPVYDCLYLALANREDATIVTSDVKLLRKVNATRLAGMARPLQTAN